MKRMNKKGFTIVELVIVIAVIAILAAVLIPTFSGVITKAKESAAIQEAAAVWKEAYALDLADGTLDGKEGTTDVAIDGKTFTYTPNDTTIFAMTVDGIAVTFDGTTWAAN